MARFDGVAHIGGDDRRTAVNLRGQQVALGQTVPLPFFPNSARDYLKALDKQGEAKALEKAGFQFLGGPYVPRQLAECNDANVKLVFDGADPLSPRFRPAAEGSEEVPWFGALAAEIFGDLERYRNEE